MQHSNNSSQIDKRLRFKKIYSDMDLCATHPFRGGENFRRNGNHAVISLSWKHTSKARKAYRRNKFPKNVYAKSYSCNIFPKTSKNTKER